MTDRIRYYALVRDWASPRTNPYCVFRSVYAPDSFRFEIWDRALGARREEMSLAAYTLHGEIGDIPITKAQADHLTATAPAGSLAV